ncbi:MAG: ATP-binding protein [Candidatus Margulisiibacteriota bacterium]|nr:ATP-binding protein [Candidatus Margulisiibacteriota bacterium]
MNILSSSGLAIFVTSIFTAVFVFYKNPKGKMNISWALFCCSLALWGLGLFFGFTAGNRAVALFWSRFLNLAAIFIPFFFLRFVYAFLGIEEERRPVLLVALTATSLYFMLSILFSDWFIPGVVAKAPFRFYPDAGVLYYFFPILYCILAGLGACDLLRAYTKADGMRRNQINYLFWGMVIGFVGGATTFPYVFNINIYPFGTWGVIIYVLAVGYAVTKFRLMDISIVISRFVAEVSAIFFEAVIYLMLVWLYRNHVSILIDLPFLVWTIAYGVLVGQLHQKARTLVQTTADKIFIKGKYDYFNELSLAIMKVGEKLSLPSILKVLYNVFYDAIEISAPRIFLPEYFCDPDKNSRRYLVYAREIAHPKTWGEEIRFEDEMVQELIRKRDVILRPHDRTRQLIIPCMVEERLVGIFVLGRKLSEDPYSPEDIRLLKVFASQAAVALDHARSYGKIKAEFDLIERQLFRSQSLASLGTLIAGVTHEIRNPLSVIRSQTELLPMKERSYEDLKKFSKMTVKHIDRVEGLVQRMLDFAKKKPKIEEEVDLNELIEASLQLVDPKKVSVEKKLNKLRKIRGVPGEIEEVFVNLMQNAVEAMPNGGKLSLKSYPLGGRIVVEVADTGKGIPEGIKEKIFDPFFSARHEGVGLGLSIAYRIIREHGGDIDIDSEPGEGTTFRIEF